MSYPSNNLYLKNQQIQNSFHTISQIGISYNLPVARSLAQQLIYRLINFSKISESLDFMQ